MTFMSRTAPGAVLAAFLAMGAAALAKEGTEPGASPLAGTWTLVAAEVQHTDGVRENDYGAAPKGLFIVDEKGRYSLQILKSERAAFASGDKVNGTPEEYEQAVLGSSTHFGVLRVDEKANTLSFVIEGSSFANWEGKTQTRAYDLKDGVLSYRVPARPNGDIPISTWRRQQ